MSDISEREESSWLLEFVDGCLQDARLILGAHLWTHSPRRFLENPWLRQALTRLREREIRVTLEVTISGLGGTVLEPGIEPTDEAFAFLDRLLETGWLQVQQVCLRVDPIQAWEGGTGRISNLDRIDGVLEKARETGLERIRVSLLSYHRYTAKILPRQTARGLRVLFLAPDDVGDVLRPWRARGLDIRTCASDLSRQGIPAGSCFDFEWVTGVQPEGKNRYVAPRKGCLCTVPESVRLWKVPRRSSCAGRCLACYAQEHL